MARILTATIIRIFCLFMAALCQNKCRDGQEHAVNEKMQAGIEFDGMIGMDSADEKIENPSILEG